MKQQEKPMEAFVSSQNMIETSENWRKQLKKFKGQEDRNQFLTEERNKFRSKCNDLQTENANQRRQLQAAQWDKDALNGEISLLKEVLQNRPSRVDNEPVEKPKRISAKRVLGLTAILAPYALIGSYIVSLMYV